MNKTKLILISLLGVVAMSLTGCIKPVEPKVLIQASANETMFVIPLVGENKENQSKLNSEEYYNQQKVAVREIQIPHRWLQTGRWEVDGRWIPTMSVIKVDRTPITVEFDVTDKTEAPIWVESADSVGFSTGFSVSAMIEENDTAKFLYRYQAKSLADVVKTEVRARIQSVAANYCATFPLDSLRVKKVEMMSAIREDVVPFFKDRGITVTTIGQFGGFQYENEKIQEAIDNVFITQQEKEKAKALLEAQKDINTRSEQATQQEKLNIQTLAQGKSEAVRLEAQAQAEAVRLKAEADAKGITMVNEATQKAQSNPLFLEVRKLEVEILKFKQWNGSVPGTLVEGDGKSGLNLFLTPATTQQVAASTTH